MEFTFGLSSELRNGRNDTIALRLLHDIDIKFTLASVAISVDANDKRGIFERGTVS